jgi:hypothetical protein
MSENLNAQALAAAAAAASGPAAEPGMVSDNSITRELVIRLIKIIDIGYVGIVYFVLGMLLAKMMDYFYGNFNEKIEKKKATHVVIFESAGMLWLNCVMIYFVRNIVSAVPFPLNGIYGFDHLRVKELTNATVFVFSYLYFQKHFQNKMKYIYDNILNTKVPQPALSAEQMVIIRKEIAKQRSLERAAAAQLERDILSSLPRRN